MIQFHDGVPEFTLTLCVNFFHVLNQEALACVSIASNTTKCLHSVTIASKRRPLHKVNFSVKSSVLRLAATHFKKIADVLVR